MRAPVVVLRTVSVEKLSPVLEACRERWPGAPLWVVSSPGRLGELERDGRVARAVAYASGSGGFGRPVRLAVRAAAVVVPVANDGGSGYGNALGAALGTRAGAYLIASRCRELRELGRGGFRARSWLERTLGAAAGLVAGYWADRMLEDE